MLPDLSVILLHDQMLDKQGKLVTTSLTLMDIHDIARSGRTYGVRNIFIAHPSPSLRKLGRTIKTHWEEGFGATYNPSRKDAMEILDPPELRDEVQKNLEEALHRYKMKEPESAK